MKHPLRRIRAILAAGVTGLLFVLAILPVNFIDFTGFETLNFFSALPFGVGLLMLAAVINTRHGYRLPLEPSNPARDWHALPLVMRGWLRSPLVNPTIQERLCWILISGLLALLGLLILCRRESLPTSFNSDVPVWQFGIAITLAGLLSLWWGRRFYFGLTHAMGDAGLVLKQFLPFALRSVVSQILALVSFSLILRASGADVDFTTLLAGASVVCFAAALPVGLNGWGVREFAAFKGNAMFRISRLAWCWFAGMTLILGLTFLIGVLEFGLTSWALTNRLFGWAVLLGYAISGAAIISLFGALGRKRLVETLLAATISVVFVHTCARIGYAIGVLDAQPPFNFDAFATNRNSFAFQTLIVFGLSIALLKPNKQLPSALFTAAIAVLFFAILQSGSLTGILSAVNLSLVLGLLLKHHRRRLLIATLSALLLWQVGNTLATEAINYIQSIWSPAIPRDGRFRPLTNLIFIESSLSARLQSIQDALQAFLQHPVFGAGLGWGIHTIVSAAGQNIVIHSTYIWILAETGLVGFIGAFWYPCLVLLPKIRTLLKQHLNPVQRMSLKAAPGLWVVVIGISFGLFSVTHEIGYQRLLWLIIGAACALPMRTIRSDTVR